MFGAFPCCFRASWHIITSCDVALRQDVNERNRATIEEDARIVFSNDLIHGRRTNKTIQRDRSAPSLNKHYKLVISIEGFFKGKPSNVKPLKRCLLLSKDLLWNCAGHPPILKYKSGWHFWKVFLKIFNFLILYFKLIYFDVFKLF
jgi:hypothetical protein